MIDLFPFEGLPVAVFGLDGAGRAAARALHLSGAEVWAWDDDEAKRAAAAGDGVPLVDLYVCDWHQPVSLVVGDNETNAIAARARAAGVEVIGEVELLARAQRDAQYVGVAGAGAETAAAIIGHVLRLAGRDAEVGGGPRAPALGLYPLGADGVYVLAMSPGEIERTVSITFDVGVMLDGGGDAETAARMRGLFRRQTPPRTAVVCTDDADAAPVHAALAAAGAQRVVAVSGRGRLAGGVYVADGVLYDARDGSAVPVLDLGEVPAIADAASHRLAAAAYAAATAAGVAPPVAMACLRSFSDEDRTE